MCARRGDETEYKLYRFQHADGRRWGGPGLPSVGDFLSLGCQTGSLSKLAGELWNYLWKHIVEVRPRVDPSDGRCRGPHIHNQPLFF